MKKLNLKSVSEVRTLVTRAKSGDEKALNELFTYNKRIAKQANTRLSRLEKTDFDYYAYDRATSFTKQEYNNARFSMDKKKLSDIDDLHEQILEVQTFLESPTSTVSGQQKIFDARIKFFREKRKIDIPEGKEREFIDYIRSDAFSAMKFSYVSSDQIINDFAELFKKEVSIKDIEKEFAKVLLTNEDAITYDVALENLGIEL